LEEQTQDRVTDLDDAPNTQHDLTHSQVRELLAENEHLKQSKRAILDALAFVCHEWRNQITQLRVTADKLRHGCDGLLTSEQELSLQCIHQGLITMQNIADNYLTLARLEEGMLTVQPTFVDLEREIFEPIQFIYADLLDETGQKCVVKLNSSNTLVWAECVLLRIVFDNLLGNAIKNGEQGSTIILSFSERGTEHEFSVWNSGPGIESERLESIFSMSGHPMNEEGDSSTSLYLVRKIIEAHGGRVWAESQPGAWANIIFTLPGREMGVKPNQQ
jgi:signal transduction histidine kinase